MEPCLAVLAHCTQTEARFFVTIAHLTAFQMQKMCGEPVELQQSIQADTTPHHSYALKHPGVPQWILLPTRSQSKFLAAFWLCPSVTFLVFPGSGRKWLFPCQLVLPLHLPPNQGSSVRQKYSVIRISDCEQLQDSGVV